MDVKCFALIAAFSSCTLSGVLAVVAIIVYSKGALAFESSTSFNLLDACIVFAPLAFLAAVALAIALFSHQQEPASSILSKRGGGNKVVVVVVHPAGLLSIAR